MMPAEDGKNIFARSTIVDAGIVGSENKKSSTAERRMRKKKKVTLKKVRIGVSAAEEGKKEDSAEDDGFDNYDSSALGASANNFFDPRMTGRASMASEHSTRKLKRIAVDRIAEE